MANAFLINKYGSKDDTSLYIKEKIRKSLNNYPLCVFSPNGCDDITIPEVMEPVVIDNKTMSEILNGITFEKIYQNIASYPSHVEMVNKRHFIKTYYLNDTDTITVDTNMETDNHIITHMSGATGHNKVLIKDITYVKNSHIDTEYFEGDDNET